MNTLRNFAVIVAALALLRAQQNAYLQVIHAVADAVGVGSPIVADSIDLTFPLTEAPLGRWKFQTLSFVKRAASFQYPLTQTP